jgi:hypothetical protein
MTSSTIRNAPATLRQSTANSLLSRHEAPESQGYRASLHKHWLFVRPINTIEDGEQIELPVLPPAPPAPRIFAPHTAVTRGRRRKDHTTRHDPSQLELTQGPPACRQGLISGEETSAVSYNCTIKQQAKLIDGQARNSPRDIAPVTTSTCTAAPSGRNLFKSYRRSSADLYKHSKPAKLVYASQEDDEYCGILVV